MDEGSLGTSKQTQTDFCGLRAMLRPSQVILCKNDDDDIDGDDDNVDDDDDGNHDDNDDTQALKGNWLWKWKNKKLNINVPLEMTFDD